MKDQKYFVILDENCDHCSEGIVYDDDWEACIQELSLRADEDDILDWFNERHGNKYLRYKDLPPEEHDCPFCDGEAKVRKEVPLIDALLRLNVAFVNLPDGIARDV